MRHGLRPNQISSWMKQVRDNAAGLFALGASFSRDSADERSSVIRPTLH